MQRRQNRSGGVNSGEYVDPRHPKLDGIAFGFARHGHQSGERLQGHIVTGFGRTRAGLAEPGDRGVDKPRIQPAERGVVETVTREVTHLEVLDQDVGMGRKPAGDLLAAGVL